MSKAEDLRDKAAESLELAKAARTAERKSRLLILAQAWLQLAERVRGSTQPDRPNRHRMSDGNQLVA
jgi:hypothetical protein